MSGCVFFPWPHTVARNSHLSGRVLDDETGLPIAGALVELSDSKSYYGDVATRTNDDGYFDLPPTQTRAYIIIVPLLPFDYFSFCSDALRIHGPAVASGVRADPKYREQTIEVHSCPPDPIPGSPSPSNEDIRDTVGEIRLKHHW